ncbi:MAG: hypothetical protein ACQXXH_05705 [Candidatus Bathyarchaeia archaeon]|jgi:hypothetical protein|nr:hypothetical protein [Candidatus Bathyarchaeota archaeon A05DMB-4]MDH7595590.1 hypothetical protein [Candidatus Bathyarchaeota archaeon]
MNEQITLQLTPETRTKLAEIAKDCNLPIEKTCEIILTQFAHVVGGRVYAGRWREAEGGLMFVVQWPFLSGLAKISDEELAKTGAK